MGGSSFPLSSLRPGRKARVMKLGVGGPLRQRLLDMGLVPGTVVEVLREAPFGGPVAYRIRGACVALRRVEAGGIVVEEV